MIFYTADLHFGSDDVIEKAKRPFSSSREMDETVIYNWNNAISDNDTVYLIGDIGNHNIPFPDEKLRKLRGHKHLIRGNHDTGFENADIVFLTDGLCELPEDYLTKLHKEQAARKFTVTGILLDAGTPGMDFSLTPFCQKIYRTSELAGDEIVRSLVTQRM